MNNDTGVAPAQRRPGAQHRGTVLSADPPHEHGRAGVGDGMAPAEDGAHSRIPLRQFKSHLKPMVDRMIRDIVQEIRQSVPAYAKPLDGTFGKILVTGVEHAVMHMIDTLDNPHADRTQWDDWFRFAGRVEYLEGRAIDALQTAVRIGTRVGWRHLRDAGEDVRLPNATMFALADALFRYSDDLCAVAIAGYTEAQAKSTGTVERRRRQLLKVLTNEQPSSEQTIGDLAAAAQWPIPDRLVAVALEYRPDQYTLPECSLGQDVLLDLESNEPCLLMAAPERHLDTLAAELDGRRAAVGPVVPIASAHGSLATARRALALAERGIVGGDGDDGIIQCSEHLTTLALCADEFLLAHMTTAALQPLDGLTVKQRQRLSETLLAWLGTRGGINEVAARLGVHPQTVRYRMNQVNERFGEQLDDPDERLKLEIALRAGDLIGR
ncbi:MAG: PucR family transcriptional regulator [Actinophytocola sp.]|nr:PucR family transcriptional regulator [Actinophytocola sp.]